MPTPDENGNGPAEGSGVGNNSRRPAASLANLRPPWRKGEAVAGRGRPKGRPSLTRLIVKILDEKVGKAKKPATLWEALARSIVVAAIKGSFAQQSAIWERIDGKVPDRLIADMAVDHSFERALQRAYGDAADPGEDAGPGAGELTAPPAGAD